MVNHGGTEKAYPSRKLVKEKIIASLTDQELYRIKAIAKGKNFWHFPPEVTETGIRETFTVIMSPVIFFSLMSLALRGFYDKNFVRWHEYTLLKELPRLKEKISNVDLPDSLPPSFPLREYKSSLNYLKPPPDFVLTHPTIGNVSVTHHAWKRFRTRTAGKLRFSKKYRSQLLYCEAMQTSFARSKATDIKCKAIKVLRIIRNRFEPTLYYQDDILMIRFVVSENDKTLLTVELPYS